MARQPKGPRGPEMYRCATPQCGRNLVVSQYMAGLQEDTQPDRIHRMAESGMVGFTLSRTCGHYTVVSPWREASPAP